MNNVIVKLTALALAVALSGCAYNHRQPKEVQSELEDAILSHNVELPQDVARELGSSSPSAGEGVYAPTKRFRVQAQDIDAKEFFASLVMDSNYSIVVHPQVTGSISVDLKNVTVGEVLNAVSRLYGYDIQQKDRIFYVYPSDVRTETFSVDYLLVSRNGKSSLNITTGGVSNSDSDSDSDSSSSSSGSSSSDSDSDSDSQSFDGDSGTTVNTSTENAFWKSLETALNNFIGKGQGKSVMVNSEAGLVVVSATPSELRTVRNFLDSAMKRMTRQILLEAKVLEVTLNEDFQHGIDWELIWSNRSRNAAFGGSSMAPDTINATLGGIFSFTYSGSHHVSTVVNLLQTQGDVSILSSPRITASNNQKAVIKVGSDEYFVTSVETSTVTGGGATTSTPSVEFTPFFSGVSLDVTPQIDDDNNIIMHVHPAVISVEEQRKTLQLGEGINIPMAKSTIRETDTVVRAKSGDVIIIGGLMSETKIDQEDKVPLLGDVPVLGNLFKNAQKATQKTELVILLRPVVVEKETWKNELRRSNQLLESWFPEPQVQRGLIKD
ncbi:MAG: pilus (MSHA type) biogenesis protein MshL [Succinivibrionaceae bacterium]|nr:pilus (MSHA type) biogenesis protein MshL [Succinivibrionaceae bacterium]